MKKAQQQTATHRLDQRTAAFITECRRKRIRVTPQRLEIFRDLTTTYDHPDADQLFRRMRKRMPTVGLDTIYRTLALLEHHGMISRVAAPGNRARFDGHTHPHHHFICTECGAIRDIHSRALDKLKLPNDLKRCGDIASLHVDLWGICAQCRSKNKTQSHNKTMTGKEHTHANHR